MPTIFIEPYLETLLGDAELDIVNQVDYLFYRFALDVISGTSVYTLPDFFRKAIRVTWKGTKVEPITWQQMLEFTPATFVGGDETYEYSSGKPRYYCFHPTNYRQIRFFPTPNETIAYDADNDNLFSTNISDRVIVSCWRSPIIGDDNYTLPSYVKRRTEKAYAGMRAFAKEGKGQNLAASRYYKQKYAFLVEMFRKINSGVFVSKMPRLNSDIKHLNRKPGRPMLPSNFPANSW
jgi:hypothetical protein